MAHKERSGHSICPGTVLSALSILLYCAGFIRVELRLNDQDSRLNSLQDAQNTVHHTDPEENKPLERARRSAGNPSPVDIKQEINKRVDALFKMCQQSGSNACVHGPRGPPGEPGQRGSRGKRGQKGRRGATGHQGIMGPPGKSGKQGIMGNPGPRGEKGNTGDAGPQGLPGPRGKPGESISSPHVIVSPSSVTTNESMTARLQCSSTGNPKPQIEWTRDGGSLPGNRTVVSDLGELLIKSVGLQDSGMYRCSARNILGMQEGSGNLTVQAQPLITLNAGPTYVAENTNVTLPKCHVTGFPVPKVTWSKVFGSLPVINKVQQDGQVTLMNVTKQDSGLYKCEASNTLGSDSSSTNLVVVPLPRIIVKPPEVLRVPKGKDVSAICRATGDSRITVTWSKSNGVLPTGRSQVLADGTLKITNVVKEDEGQYICIASIGIFKSQAVMQLNGLSSCEAVGVQDRNRIPDSSMTAPTIFSSRYFAHYGRLHDTRGGGWSAKTQGNINDYLQIDLGAKHVVCAVATQGEISYYHWTTRYKLSMSLNGVHWFEYRENNKHKEFSGNFDRSTVVKHYLAREFSTEARYVRFSALAYHGAAVLRVEVFVWK